mgnify:CR=1 FL=1
MTFIDYQTMRRLNWRFLRHRGVTDVLTFRYSHEPLGRALRSARHFRSDGHQGRAECRHRRGAGLASEDGTGSVGRSPGVLRHSLASEDGTGSVAGEILIAPACAKRYARRHGLGYQEELARYVVHGLLHWVGHDDATPLQQRRMRALEDQLLACCGVRS